jgi:hypothetical protein
VSLDAEASFYGYEDANSSLEMTGRVYGMPVHSARGYQELQGHDLGQPYFERLEEPVESLARDLFNLSKEVSDSDEKSR